MRGRILLRGLSCALLVAVGLVYLFRPDWAAALTLFPFWVWVIGGGFLTLVAWSRQGKRIGFALLALWTLALCVFAEEPRSLLRGLISVEDVWQEARNSGEGFRVVSLNCAGGSMTAAREVIAYRPDIVLLQESPPKSQTLTLAKEYFGGEGSILVGLDASIVVRGTLTPISLPRAESRCFVLAKATLKSGRELYLLGLRFIPPVAREDLWNADCWRQQRENRQARRLQMQEMVQRIQAAIPADAPLILGGDCNAPQEDAVFRLLRPRLHDSFAEGGRGWGNTAINEFPVLRIDQIWLSRHFQALHVRAHHTQHSDHRLVTCDVLWNTP
jgi:hypothetical protein